MNDSSDVRVRRDLLQEHIYTMRAAANAAAEALVGIERAKQALEMLGYQLSDSSLQKAAYWATETADEFGRLTLQ